MHIGLHDHRQQGPVDAAARLQQRREERPFPQLISLHRPAECWREVI
jgi:hypothetical protein